VKQLLHPVIGQQALEIGAVIGRPVQLHDMGVAVSGRQLHQADLVAHQRQSLSLGVHGDPAAQIESGGKIAFVQMNGHEANRSSWLIAGGAP